MKPFKFLSLVIAVCLYITSCSNNVVVTTGECIIPMHPDGGFYPDTKVIFPENYYIGKFKVIDSAIFTELFTNDNLYFQSENIYTHEKKTLIDANTIRNLILSNPLKSNRYIGFIRLERKIANNLYLFAYNFNLEGVDTLGSSSNVRYDFAIYDVLNNKIYEINYGDFYNYIGFSSFPVLTFEYENNGININVVAEDVLQLTRFKTYDDINIKTSLFNNSISQNQEELKYISKSKIIKAVPHKKNIGDYDYYLSNSLNGFTLSSKQDSFYLDRDILVTDDDSLYISGFNYKEINYLFIQNLYSRKLEIINLTEKYCLYGKWNLQILNNEEVIFQAVYIPDFKFYLYKYNIKTKTLSKIDLMF